VIRLGPDDPVVPISTPPSHRQGPPAARDSHDHPGPGAGRRRKRRSVGWIGRDDRGVELEMVALDLPDAVVVIHVMPTASRR
jgi:hypothetical protein